MAEAATIERKKPGRKPRPPLTETPEFQAAVAKVAGEAVQAMMASLAPKVQSAGIAEQPGTPEWMQQLALTLAEIGSQGTGRKAVDPKVLKARADARDRMVDLIVAARREGAPATYRLKNKVVLADRLIEPFYITSDKQTKPVEIDWAGVPNDAMIPMNDTAKAIHAEFINSIGNVERVAPEERLGVTAGGLVVRNGAAVGTASQRVPQEAPPSMEDMGLKIHHQNEPGRYKEVRVLGSVQPPALQSI